MYLTGSRMRIICDFLAGSGKCQTHRFCMDPACKKLHWYRSSRWLSFQPAMNVSLQTRQHIVCKIKLERSRISSRLGSDCGLKVSRHWGLHLASSSRVKEKLRCISDGVDRCCRQTELSDRRVLLKTTPWSAETKIRWVGHAARLPDK